MVLNVALSLSLLGAPLKVCPQGFSCCTVEMEEKLSQQSRTEIKAPVSRLSTNLQSTFKQRHSHFDSKRTHWAETDTTTLCCFLVSLQQHMHVLRDLWRTPPPAIAPPQEETVSLCPLARPPVPQHLSSLPCCFPLHSLVLRCQLPSPPETCMLADRPHTSSDLGFSVLPVLLCVSNS